jgi:hypothetical protein
VYENGPKEADRFIAKLAKEMFPEVKRATEIRDEIDNSLKFVNLVVQKHYSEAFMSDTGRYNNTGFKDSLDARRWPSPNGISTRAASRGWPGGWVGSLFVVVWCCGGGFVRGWSTTCGPLQAMHVDHALLKTVLLESHCIRIPLAGFAVPARASGC